MTRKNENHWVFGLGSHIEFENGTDIVVHPTRPLDCWEGSASISDHTNGELLFFTDGEKLWDANNNIVASGLGSSQSPTAGITPAQGALIVPPTGTGTNFHVFSTTTSDPFEGPQNDLMHTLFDVSGSGLSVNVNQASTTVSLLGGIETTERLAATYNNNCTGYWVVTQELNTKNFHVIAVTGDNPGPVSVQNFPMINQFVGFSGCMKFSPNASLLAYASITSEELVVFDFDNQTGILTYRFRVSQIVGDVYGVEFSPDNNLIYYSTIRNSKRALYQIPVGLVDEVHANSTLIHDGKAGPEQDWFGSLQLGPDDKIYISQFLDLDMSVINNPDVAGPGCNFDEFVYDKNGDKVLFAVPQSIGFPSFTRRNSLCDLKETESCCPFPWFSASILNHHNSTQALEKLTVYIGSYNNPGTDLTAHQSLAPLSTAAELVDLSLFKGHAQPSTFSGIIDFSLVVLDFQGNTLRTLSTSTIDFGTALESVWIPIPISSNQATRTIQPGEVVAGQLTFSSDPGSANFPYQLTGRGKWV